MIFGSGMIDVLALAAIGIVSLIVLAVIIARLYRRASKEVSFVRTGFGGEKVVMNGGALVLPVLHEIIPVNMNTLRLAVERKNDQALITRDRMRVDVLAEFYVRVQPSSDAISAAAQTLGLRTMQPQELKNLIEGKFVDALRSVAAELSMTELHEKRTDFVQRVQQVVSEDLLKNGLELESVSLTGLDQTGMEFFNPSNAFDAEGLTRLTEEIEQRKKIRNDIEQDTQVQIKKKNLTAAQESLTIDRDEQYARLEQEREVETRRAQQNAEIAREQAEKDQSAQQARILADREVEQSKIDADRVVSERRIAMEQEVRELEIAKERAVETQQVEKVKSVELAEQDKAIAIAEKSRDQSEARAEADRALALAVEAEEQVKPVRQSEVAERDKRIELIEAAKQAAREAIAIRVAAEAEKAAAVDHAEAKREDARGAADEQRIKAEAESTAEKLLAEAAKARYEVAAEGQRAVNEAANLLSPDQIAMQIKLKLIENLDQIIRESVKPVEAIDSIKIVQVDGLTGAPSDGSAVNGQAGQGNVQGNLADQVVNSALRYRAQAPLLDELLSEVGLNGTSTQGLAKALQEPGETNGTDLFKPDAIEAE